MHSLGIVQWNSTRRDHPGRVSGSSPVIGSLRDKKGSCSTWRGLRVGTRFREFSQTPRCRGFSLLGFYSLFKYFTNV